MKSIAVAIIFFTLTITYASCATITPSNNPECQSFADIINDIKKRFDQIPISLLPIPGLDPNQPTTLQCYEFPNCTGFNCSGKVYGTHIQFSFNLDYCAKPVTANITLTYPAERVSFARTIKHAQQFFITSFNFTVPQTSIKIPVQLFGKIDMVRSPGRVTVTAGIVPKFNLIFVPVALQPFNLLNNQVIRVDTSRCGDDPTTSAMVATSPSSGMSTSNSPGISNSPGSSSSPQMGSSSPSMKSTTSTIKGTSTATNGAATTRGLSSGGAQTGNSGLTGGEIAAIVMSIVAIVAVIGAVVLYFQKYRAPRQRHHTFRNETPDDKAKF